DFWNFLLKKLDKHSGMGARQDNLRPATRDLHAYDVSSNPVPLPVALPRHLLFFRKNGIGATEIHNNVALLEALHNAIDQLSFPPLKLIIDNLPLAIRNAWDDILLGCLCGDTAEHARIQFAQELIADLGIRIKSLSSFLQGHLHGRILHVFYHRLGFEELHLADLRIELGLDLPLMTESFLGRGDHGIFQSADKDGLVNAFFLVYFLNTRIACVFTV